VRTGSPVYKDVVWHGEQLLAFGQADRERIGQGRTASDPPAGIFPLLLYSLSGPDEGVVSFLAPRSWRGGFGVVLGCRLSGAKARPGSADVGDPGKEKFYSLRQVPPRSWGADDAVCCGTLAFKTRALFYPVTNKKPRRGGALLARRWQGLRRSSRQAGARMSRELRGPFCGSGALATSSLSCSRAARLVSVEALPVKGRESSSRHRPGAWQPSGSWANGRGPTRRGGSAGSKMQYLICFFFILFFLLSRWNIFARWPRPLSATFFFCPCRDKALAIFLPRRHVFLIRVG